MPIRTQPRRRHASDRQPRNHVPRLPHPSWTFDTARFDSGSGQHIASASEFWSRLGA